MEASAIRLEAIAIRVEAIAIGVEAIASRLEAIVSRCHGYWVGGHCYWVGGQSLVGWRPLLLGAIERFLFEGFIVFADPSARREKHSLCDGMLSLPDQRQGGFQPSLPGFCTALVL